VRFSAIVAALVCVASASCKGGRQDGATDTSGPATEGGCTEEEAFRRARGAGELLAESYDDPRIFQEYVLQVHERYAECDKGGIPKSPVTLFQLADLYRQACEHQKALAILERLRATRTCGHCSVEQDIAKVRAAMISKKLCKPWRHVPESP
jgi:hypothetical protein